MKIAVIGMGYVGLSIATLLSQKETVYAVDVAAEKIDLIREKRAPFEDPEIQKYLKEKPLRLVATMDEKEAYKGADYVVIAVPTNFDLEKNYFDTSVVEAVLEQAMRYASDAVIVIKSTLPLGYTRELWERTGNRKIMFSPEFLREGRALLDNLCPSRIIVGTDMADDGLRRMANAFAQLMRSCAVKKDAEIMLMNAAEAEAVKLFSNTYLALRVAYFNELDTYAECMGLDTRSIIDGVCADPRIGDAYRNPSFGYGGYCLPKDARQLLANYDGIPQNVISAAVAANDTRIDFITSRILKQKPEVVGIYRLNMKSGSDNIRQSASGKIIARLKEKRVRTIVYEPMLRCGTFEGCAVVGDLKRFKEESGVIVANRMDAELEDVAGKVYTRDIYKRD